MSLSKNYNKNWPLRDKYGREPSDTDRKIIEKLPRDLLFPCSSKIADLEITKKHTAPSVTLFFAVISLKLQKASIYLMTTRNFHNLHHIFGMERAQVRDRVM